MNPSYPRLLLRKKWKLKRKKRLRRRQNQLLRFRLRRGREMLKPWKWRWPLQVQSPTQMVCLFCFGKKIIDSIKWSRSIFLLSFHVTTAILLDNCQEIIEAASEKDCWKACVCCTDLGRIGIAFFELNRNKKLPSDASLRPKPHF